MKMSQKILCRWVLGAGLIMLLAGSARAEQFIQPTLSGTTASGLLWSDVASGTNLPIRTSGTNNGAPGAVAYYDVDTGKLQIDPHGWDVALVNFTYTTGSVNISGTTPGPFVYTPWGTSPSSSIVSLTTGESRRLPAGTWTLITAYPARLAGTISLVRVPTLATSGLSSNIASSNGWFNRPWNFGTVMSNTLTLAEVTSNFKVFGVTGHANANVLGYGNYVCTFQYTVDGITGNQVGPVIPCSFASPTMVVPGNGPCAGGNLILVTNAAPALGNGSDITNVTVGGQSAVILEQGPNWVRISAPAYSGITLASVVIQSASAGVTTLSDVYTYNPPGVIGGGDGGSYRWYSVGQTNVPGQVNAVGANNTIYGLAYDPIKKLLYAGGAFTNIGGTNCSRVAMWNGAGWTNLGVGVVQYANVNCVTPYLNVGAYFGGYFTNIGGINTRAIGYWNGTNFSGFGGEGLYFSAFVNGYVNSVATLSNGAFVAGGYFTNANNSSVEGVNYIAKWTGTGWTNMQQGFRNVVIALAADSNGTVYAGGGFTNHYPTNTSVHMNYIARWDGSAWTNMARGLGNRVTCMIIGRSNELYVGGWFTNAINSAGTSVGMNFVARWDGNNWTNVGADSFNNWVYALAVDHKGRLWAGGAFTNCNGYGAARCAAARIARWDGNNWTNVGDGVNDNVLSLASDPDSDTIYAGGLFKLAYQDASNSTSCWYVAKVIAESGPGVYPTSGSITGGYPITITGTNLGDGLDVTNVTLCGASVASIVSQSATQVVVTAGGSVQAGLGDVVVYSTGYGATVASNAFTYLGSMISVVGTNGVALTNGAAASLSAGTDFGAVSSGQTVTNRLSVTNAGNEALTLSWTTNGSTAFAVVAGPATVSPGTASNFWIRFTASGSVSTAALPIAHNAFDSPLVVNLSGSVAMSDQTITFPAIGDQVTTNRVELSASASSGLPVTFAVADGPASISGGTNLTFSSTGSVSIVASQVGNESWNPAPDVTNTFSVTAPLLPPSITAQPVSAVVSTGSVVNLSVTNSGTGPFGYQWLKDGAMLPGQTNSTLNIASFRFTDSGSYSVVITNAQGMVISFPASLSATGALLKAWGHNNYGQLGIGTIASTNYPVTVASNAAAAACGNSHSLFVKSDGTLWGMGNNEFSQLGNGTVTSTNRPIQVASNVAAVAGGSYHSLFVKADGTLWSVGYNSYGQLGIGSLFSTNWPVQVASNVVTVAGGSYHSLFVKADGTLWVMGRNTSGQLGNGTTSNTNRPVQVASNVVAAASGYDHSLFVKADGTLWVMGANSYGQLGNGTTSNTNRPVQVASNVVAAVGGGYHTLFVKADGTLWGMGYNGDGELGNGTTSSTNRPVKVASNVVSVVGGGQHSLFVKADGTLWGMGANSYGQLGCGTMDLTNRPVQVLGLLVASLAKEPDAYYSLAIAMDVPKADQTITFPAISDKVTTDTVGLSATASSGLPVSFSVLSGSASITGGTNLTFSGAGSVSVVASQAGDASWNPAPDVTNTFTVTEPPLLITAQPVSAVVATGSVASLSVTNSGTGPFWYQWLKNGVMLSGQTNSTLSIASFQITDSGSYSVVITNGQGMAISMPASLSTPDASLRAWGRNDYGQLGDGTTNNASLQVQVASNVVSAVRGYFHSLFVNADGTLWAMGQNTYGQLGNGTTTDTNLPTQVASNVVAAAGGTYHSLFVKADGTLWAMGYNGYGQLGNGTTNSANLPVQVASNVVAAACGASHSLFVKADGTLWAMGYNYYGQLGDGTLTNTNRPVQVASNVVSVAGGYMHSLFVKADGTLRGMGRNNHGQLGDGTGVSRPLPVQVASNVVAAAGGYLHSLFVKADGTLWAMGQNTYGQLGTGTNSDTNRPVPVASNVTAAACGQYHSLFVKADGTLWAMGRNDYGQLGDGTNSDTNLPVQGSGLLTACLTPGPMAYHSLAIAAEFVKADQTIDFPAIGNKVTTDTVGLAATASSGLPVSFSVFSGPASIAGGTNLTFSGAGSVSIVASQAGDSNWNAAPDVTNNFSVAALPPAITAQPVGAVVTNGASVSLSVTNSGTGPFWYQWLKNGVMLSGQTNSTLSIASFQVTDSGNYSVVITNAQGMAISFLASLSTPDASLRAWGWNAYGQLGNGTTNDVNRPVQVVSNVTAAAGGYMHSLIVKADGTLWGTGDNSRGQLGNGTNARTNRPVQVASNVAAAACGYSHSLFVKADGTLWGMGANLPGQLGNGTMTDTNRPTQVTNNVVAAACGYSHSLFVKADGTLWAMGYNINGQLGNGTTSNTNRPVQVASNVAAAAGGNGHSLFVKADGTLWAMGDNYYGQLGNGSYASTNLPVQVASNVVAAACGYYHSLFVKADGTLWAMGYNDNGQLGSGTTSKTNLPVQVASNVVAAAGGYSHSLFVKADGTLWAMGLNTYGQLGNGTTITTNRPAQVRGLLAAGLAPGSRADHSLAIAADAPKDSQTITFPILAAQMVTNRVGLAATASSGLPVTFSVLSGPALLSGGTNLTFSGVGSVSIVASQMGDSSYNAAPEVTNTTHVYSISMYAGPYAGGNTITITNGNFGAITNVLVGGVRAAIQASGANWATITVPAIGATGWMTIVIQTSDHGDYTLANAYKVNPAGQIGLVTEDWNQWQPVAGLPAAMAHGKSDVLNGRMFVAGGWKGYSSSSTNASSFDGSAWRLEPVLPADLRYFGAATYSGAFYAVAGHAGLSPTNVVRRFDGSSWAVTTPYPLDKSSMLEAAVFGDYLYALGGHDGSQGNARTNAYRFDGTTWTATPGLSVKLFNHAMATFRDSLYVVGGQDETGALQTNVYRFNGAAWTEVSGLPTAKCKVVTAVLRGELYAIAGQVGFNPNASVHRFDGTNWVSAPSYPLSVVGAVADVVENYLYVAGGTPDDFFNYVTNAYRYPAMSSAPGVVPSSGSWIGGYQVVLSGSDLGNGSDITNVTLCGVSAASIVSQSATQIVIVAGVAAPGLGDVRVFSTSFGETVKSNAFTYTGAELQVMGTNGALIVSGEDPSRAKGTTFGHVGVGAGVTHTLVLTNAGNESALITGWSMPGDIPDFICGLEAMPFALASSSSRVVEILFSPDSPGTKAATLIISNNTPSGAYTVKLTGDAYQLSTNAGPYAGGHTITITNGNFGVITNVLVGGVAAAIQSSGANWVTIIVPAVGSSGPQAVVIQTSDGGVVTLADAYTVHAPGGIFDSTPTYAWEEIAGLPVALYAHAVGVLSNRLYVMGGNSGATNTYQFDGTNWSQVAGLPNGREYLTAGAFSNALYAIGGRSGGTATNVYRYDGAAWTQVAGLPTPRYSMACGVLGSALYAVGGFGTAVHSNNYRFDGANWSEVAGLPQARCEAGGGVWNGELFVAGGYDVSFNARTNVYRFNGTTWSETVGLPYSLYGAAMREWNGALYHVGGQLNGGVISSNVYQFNGTNWTQIAGLPEARTRLGVCAMGDHLYAVGGDNSGAHTNVYRYPSATALGVSPASGSWTGGYPVVINGTNLCDGSDVTNVTLCGMSAASIVSQSATQIVVVAGATAAPGLGDVRVFSTSFGETVKSNAFTYVAGQFTVLGTNGVALANDEAISRAKGTDFGHLPFGTSQTHAFAITNSGNDAMTISGWSMPGDISVFLCDLQATPFSFGAGSSRVFYVQYSADAVGNHSATLYISNNTPTGVFTVKLAGATAQLSTNVGPYAGGNTITITNGSFGSITNVLVGGVAATIQASGATWVTLTVPAVGLSGPQDIVIQTSDHGDYTLANAYKVNPAGGITAVVPSSGSWTGGYPVVIRGTNLCNGSDVTNVTLAGYQVLQVLSQSDTQVVVTAGVGLPVEDTIVTNLAPAASLTGSASFNGANYNTAVVSKQITFIAGTNASPHIDAITLQLLNDGLALGSTNTFKLDLRNASDTTTNATVGTTLYASDTISFLMPVAVGNFFTLTLGTGDLAHISGYSMSPGAGYGISLYGASSVSLTLACNTFVWNGVTAANGYVALNSLAGNSSILATYMVSLIENLHNSAGPARVCSTSFGESLMAHAFTYTRNTQAPLVFNPASPQAYATTNTLSVSGGSGTGAVSYSVTSGPGLIVGGNRLVITSGLGTVTVVAVKAQDDGYFEARTTGTVVAAKASQTITFPAIADQLTTNRIGLAATANSGLGVSFSVLSGPASLAGGTNLSFSGAGSVSIVASRAGDTNWIAAPSVTNTFTVSKAPQAALVFEPASPQVFGSSQGLSTAGGSGTGAVSYAVNSGGGAITGLTNLLATSGTGTIVVVATKASDDMYLVTSTIATVTVAKAGQTIDFAAIGNQFWTNRLGLAATASSTLTVSFAVSSGPGEIAGATNLSFSGYGEVVLVASQAGDSSFSPAPTVTNTFSVSGPIMAVTGNNTFGELIVGLQSATNTLVITNNGTARMTISGFVTNGPNAASFHLLVPTAIVHPASYLPIPLVFAPTAGGTNEASIVFTFDGTNSPYTVNVSGVGLGGGIQLSTNLLTYSTVYGGTNPVTQTLAMTNVGVSAFTYTNLISTGWLSATPSSGTVGLGGATTLTNAINNAVLNAGTHSATVLVTAADATNSPQRYVVQVTVAKADQAITFPSIAGQLTTNRLVLSATATSGLPVNFSVLSGPATIAGGTNLSFSGAGSVSIVAGQAGDTNWNAAASVTNTFTVSLTPQAALAFTPASPQVFGTSQGLSTAGGSGTGAVSYAVNSGVGQIVGLTNLLATSGTGTIVVEATKASDALYLVQTVVATVTVAKASQTLDFTALGDQFWTNRVGLAATASAGLSASFSVSSGPASITEGTNLSFSGYGAVELRVDQAGDANFNAAPTVTNRFNALGPILSIEGTTDFGPALIGRQTITNYFTLTNSGSAQLRFSGISTSGAQAASFRARATSLVVEAASAVIFPMVFDPQWGETNTASFVITFNGTNSPYTVDVTGFGFGGSIGFSTDVLAFGCTYLGADPADQSMVLTNSGSSALTWTNTISYSAEASGWLAVAPAGGSMGKGYSVPLTARVDATNLNAGTYYATNTVTAPESTNSPQTWVVTLVVDKAAQVISFPVISDQYITNRVGLAATASSGLSASFSVFSGPASLNDGTNLSFSATGAVSIVAGQAGDTNWLAAPSVTNRFVVHPLKPSISGPFAVDTNVTTAGLGATIGDVFGAMVTDRGIVWSVTNGFASESGTKAAEMGLFGSGIFTQQVSNLVSGVTNYFRAYAINHAGTSYTEQAWTLMRPEAPVLASASQIGPHSFQANWQVSRGALDYWLDVAEDVTFTNIVAGYQNLNLGDVTSQVVTGLQPGLTYYYRVRAHNDAGFSTNTPVQSVITAPRLTMVSWPRQAGDTTPVSGSYLVDFNVPVAITAAARTGYQFGGWTQVGGGTLADPSSRTTAVTLVSNSIVTAYFMEPSVVSLTLTHWRTNWTTGTLFADLSFCNEATNGNRVTGPLWFGVFSNSQYYLRQAVGRLPMNAYPYIVVTPQLFTQQVDHILDPGECFVVTNVEFYSRTFKPITNMLWTLAGVVLPRLDLVDTDGDQIPDVWEGGYEEGSQLDPLNGADDPDDDGVPTFDEWIANTDPTNPASYLHVEALSLATLDGRVIVWPSSTGRVYGVSAATNAFGPYVPLQGGLPSQPPQNSFTDQVFSAESEVFYRIDVRIP